MLTILIFIIVIGVLVFVHELGHFVMARRAGMRVEEFGFGFPPRFLAWRRRPGAGIELAFGTKSLETERQRSGVSEDASQQTASASRRIGSGTIYSLNWIPFGGFVKIFGESGEDADNSKSFASKKPGVRSKVIIAGVVMNILFAAILLGFGNIFGLRTGLPEGVSLNARDIKVQIIQVSPGSPASLAGLETLDEITGFKVNGAIINVKSISEVQDLIKNNLGKEITITGKRADESFEKQIAPRINPPLGEGALGISLATTGIIKYPWYQAIYQGIIQTAMLTAATAVGYANIIKNIFINGAPGVDLSGPVGIAMFTGKAAKIGFTYLLQLTALISINLAILNIIPFPALDGGRLLFIGIEKLKGKPVSRRIESLVNATGFALLILLMIYVTTRDIVKFF